jgi:flagellar biosynthesis/type III secretory pathway chaperone
MLELHHPPVRPPLSVPALKAEYDLVRQLHALLQREASSLAAGETASLPEIAASRQQVAASLQAIARARTQSLQLSGIAADAHAIRDYLDSSLGSGPISAAWNLLRREYARLERLNRANGAFVEAQLRYLQNRWNGLLQSAGDPGLYSHRGGNPRQRRGGGLSAAA